MWICIGARMYACMHTERPVCSPFCIIPTLGWGGGNLKLWSSVEVRVWESFTLQFLEEQWNSYETTFFHLYHRAWSVQEPLSYSFYFLLIWSNLVNKSNHTSNFLIHIWIYITSYLCVVIYTELLKPQEQDLFGKDLSFRPSLLDKLIKTTQIWLFFRLLQSL